MLRALISDVHANIEALLAVANDIRSRGVEEVYNLGDVVGYGPNPLECIDQIESLCTLSILGNHDQGVLFDPGDFNGVALDAIMWTRDEMEAKSSARRDYFDLMSHAPTKKVDGDVMYVHGSPYNPTNEYVKPEYSYERKRMDRMWQRFEWLCFCGHTHLPSIFTFDGEAYHCREAADLEDGKFRIERGCKQIINVGSVGQPRDGDTRACYLVWDDESGNAEYVRVEYDLQATIAKIEANPHLDISLSKRLALGR